MSILLAGQHFKTKRAIAAPTPSLQITTSYRIPLLSDGVLHRQLRQGDIPPILWTRNDDGSYIPVTEEVSAVAFEFYSHPTLDMSIKIGLKNVSRPLSWQSEAGNLSLGTTYEQPAGTGLVTLFSDHPNNFESMSVKGITKFPTSLHRLGQLKTLDLSSSGLVGSCDYLGNMYSLRSLDLSGNDEYVHDPKCFIDNKALRVIR